MVDPLTPEATVWAWLRLDLVDSGGSPTALEPVDADTVRALIVAAEVRLETFIGTTLAEILYESDEIPEPLTRAILLDVSNHYFSRLNPELPDAYFEAIAPWRAWSFGA
ncbi:MAG: hypothetical protein JWQ89_3121 [Devosia sp.]|uniref:head-tail connector protein n=1 Tax=Devosia sp. TaxID=1871048 RepID=UPI002614324F|nr:head-tail connector protein [Devosia sp.]MDB5541394.1 hypothetical protein [Devosia sp.]